MKKLTHKDVASVIGAVAKEEGVHGSQVTMKQVLAKMPGVTEYQIKKLGGLNKIKDAHHPVTDKDLVSMQETTDVKSYISSLEKTVAAKRVFGKRLREAIETTLKPLPKIKTKKHVPSDTKQAREIVVMLNDTHYGLIVAPEEIGDVNSYGWKQACRRTAMVLLETLNYKSHHRKEVTRCHLVLNGDLMQGIIHGLASRKMELMVHQINGAVHILTHVIAALAEEFPEVVVTGVPGNHEDFLHKREHGKRVIEEKYDSYSNILYYSLSTAFRLSEHVKFNFPKTPYAFIDLPGGRCMVNHGDTLFSRALGNPGTSINVKSLSDEIRKFNAGELAKGRAPVKLMLFGHTHSFAHFITQEGVEIYNAPSLSGLDGYAHSLTINTNLVGQVIFESTEQFIMGDSRLIRLLEADKNIKLDELIPVFNNKLAWEK